MLKLVEENAKKRFEVVWGYDPSPPRPIKKKGQNQSKKSKSTPKTAAAVTQTGQVDAAGVDDLRKEVEKALLDDRPKPSGQAEEAEAWKELPLVVVDREAPTTGTDGDGPACEWFIRASQGHSLKLEGTAHLTPVEDDAEGRERVGLMVHGTRDDLWDIIRESVIVSRARRRPAWA